MSALAVDGVVSGYGTTEILHGVDCAVGPGEIVAVVGRNGVGKSTLIKTIMGIVRPRAGSVVVAGAEVAGLSPHRIARRRVAYVPQDAVDEASCRIVLVLAAPGKER